MSHDVYMFIRIGLLLLAAFFVLINCVQRLVLRDYYLSMNDLSKHFPDSRSSPFFSQPKLIGNFSDYKFTLAYVGAKNLSLNNLYLVCDIRSSSDLHIFLYDMNPGPVLLAKRINLGDNDLDKYFIYSNNQEKAMRYFSDPARRHTIKQIMGKWQILEISGKRIYTSANIRTAPSLTPDILKTTLKDLINLRADHM